MNAKTLSLSLGFAVSSVAGAQDIWFSLVSWQVSQDEGHTWHGGTVEIADPFAHVRIRAIGDWYYPGAYAFASVSMDITITCADMSGENDSVTNAAPLAPFDAFQAQTYVATRFGHVMKIDEIRDTLPPGMGPRWVRCYQLPQNSNPNFSTAQPAPIFEFALQLDGTAGTRVVDHVNPRLPGEGEVGPLLYTTPEGGLATPPTILRGPLNLVVIPAPATLTLLLPLLALHRRRRQ